MCGFSYCSSVYCRSAAVTNSCINHCHDNTCNISCQTVRAAVAPSRAKEVQTGARRVHRPVLGEEECWAPGWALGTSPCLPAFLPSHPSGNNWSEMGPKVLKGLALVLVELEQTQLQGRAGSHQGSWNTQGGQFTAGSFPSGCIHEKILIPFYGETGKVGCCVKLRALKEGLVRWSIFIRTG